MPPIVNELIVRLSEQYGHYLAIRDYECFDMFGDFLSENYDFEIYYVLQDEFQEIYFVDPIDRDALEEMVAKFFATLP